MLKKMAAIGNLGLKIKFQSPKYYHRDCCDLILQIFRTAEGQ